MSLDVIAFIIIAYGSIMFGFGVAILKALYRLELNQDRTWMAEGNVKKKLASQRKRRGDHWCNRCLQVWRCSQGKYCLEPWEALCKQHDAPDMPLTHQQEE